MDDELVIGELRIANNVLEKMVRESATAVGGVSGLKKIEVEPDGDGLKIGLRVTLDADSVYPDVAENVQKKVADDVNGMTAIERFTVDVTVDKLDFSGE